MEAYLLEWANLLLRWVHVITAIAWIGSSFYFVFLDNNLQKPNSPDLLEKGVGGARWRFLQPPKIHGGPEDHSHQIALVLLGKLFHLVERLCTVHADVSLECGHVFDRQIADGLDARGGRLLRGGLFGRFLDRL